MSTCAGAAGSGNTSPARHRPLLRFEQGTGEVAGRVTTRRRGLSWIAERPEADLSVPSATVFQADAPDTDVLVEMLADRIPGRSIAVAVMGPVMGTQLGPGCVGVTYVKG